MKLLTAPFRLYGRLIRWNIRFNRKHFWAIQWGNINGMLSGAFLCWMFMKNREQVSDLELRRQHARKVAAFDRRWSSF